MNNFLKILVIPVLAASSIAAKPAFPNICTVVNTPAFLQLLQLTTTHTVCPGIIPRPCVHFSYYVPKYFVEVVSNPGETFFSSLPGVKTQLGSLKDFIPYGAEASSGSYSYHAHALNVPLAQWGFEEMPCGGTAADRYCFSAMSEHLGMSWKTGAPDMGQPAFQAWGLAPKACIVKGAAESAIGTTTAGYGGGSPLCSLPMDWMPKYPPSAQSVCTGWGIHFPRSGTATSSDQATASLVIASRIKSLAAEVFQTLSVSGDEKWQMIYPNSSAGFREGQNISILWGSGVNEVGRLRGTFKNYLYVIWQRKSCIRDLPYLATTNAWLTVLQSACKGA